MMPLQTLLAKIKPYLPLIKQVAVRSSLIFVAASVLIFVCILLPQRAISTWRNAFATSLETKRSLLAQTRVIAFELSRIKPTDEVSRVRLINQIQSLNTAQHTLFPATPPSSPWVTIVLFGQEKDDIRAAKTGAAAVLKRHEQFLTPHDAWLYELEHTSVNNVRSFLISSSSVAHLTELTNIILEYRFWIEKAGQ